MVTLKKIVYYLYIGLCVVLILLHLFGPYGGISFVLDYIKRGFYDMDRANQYFSASIVMMLQVLNRFVSFLFWSSVFFPILLLPIKLSSGKKIKFTFICMAIVAIIIFSPKILKLIY